jgi:hypothetical protein
MLKKLLLKKPAEKKILQNNNNRPLSCRGYAVIPGEQILCFCPFILVLVLLSVRLSGQNQYGVIKVFITRRGISDEDRLKQNNS